MPKLLCDIRGSHGHIEFSRLEMKNSATFKIDALPVSTNKAVGHSRRGGYKTQEYKDWEQLVMLTQKEKTIKCSEWYGVEMVYHFPIYYKNGNIRRVDGPNFDKYNIDIVLRRLKDKNGEEIDDCRLIEWSGCKVNSEKEHTEITFYCIE